jgi:protoheme IX farnesyltransferase
MERGNTIIKTGLRRVVAGKLKDYYILVKFRLSFIVVFSAGIGYLFADGAQSGFLFFLLGGFLITAASNALNQVLEIDTDKLMARTADRPLAALRMPPAEATLAAGIFALTGIGILWYFFNPVSALIGALSLISYAFVYTPVKKISPVAVLIGAFPGAAPPVIGVAAATGNITETALILFAIQFIWQFPHFWSIAWVAYDDYAKAGFYLLPSTSGKTRASASRIVMYTLLLIPVGLLPFALQMSGLISSIVTGAAGILFLWQAYRLYRTCDEKDARMMMFGSFLYLPVVFISLLIDKL